MPAAVASTPYWTGMTPLTFVSTVGNSVIAILMCFALYVVTRRAIHAWAVGEAGEKLFWSLVVLGTVSLTLRAIRRTRDSARRER
jgi:hypothetical protein